MTRLAKIRSRALLMSGSWLQRDEASLVREPDDFDLREQRQRGAQSGASWVFRHRGLNA